MAEEREDWATASAAVSVTQPQTKWKIMDGCSSYMLVHCLPIADSIGILFSLAKLGCSKINSAKRVRRP